MGELCRAAPGFNCYRCPGASAPGQPSGAGRSEEITSWQAQASESASGAENYLGCNSEEFARSRARNFRESDERVNRPGELPVFC
jgi:hypothetical protein